MHAQKKMTVDVNRVVPFRAELSKNGFVENTALIVDGEPHMVYIKDKITVREVFQETSATFTVQVSGGIANPAHEWFVATFPEKDFLVYTSIYASIVPDLDVATILRRTKEVTTLLKWVESEPKFAVAASKDALSQLERAHQHLLALGITGPHIEAVQKQLAAMNEVMSPIISKSEAMCWQGNARSDLRARANIREVLSYVADRE